MHNTLFPLNVQNILPDLGEAFYYGRVLTADQAYAYFEHLKNHIYWENERLKIAGKTIHMSRKVAWYGDKAYHYTYSGETKIAKLWTKALLELKTIAESCCKTRYNSCLLNYYPDGTCGMGWHSDNENSILAYSSIASISLGAERTFSFKQKSGSKKLSLQLENGSLFEMKGLTQEYWLHSLPKSKKVSVPRINLTFRSMKTQI